MLVEDATNAEPIAMHATNPVDNAFLLLDKDKLIKALQDIEPAKCINGKPLFKSYGKWNGLKQDQRVKVKQFWTANLDDAARQSIQDSIVQAVENAESDETARQALTSKHDKVRLLHLRVDPSMAGIWTSALREKTRQELDDRTGAVFEDPYSKLAEKFNDPSNIYQNATIIPGKIDANGCYCSVPGMESLAFKCYDIDPSMPTRPLRDGGWLRTKFKELKTAITKCYARFLRSGNQDAEHIYDEWALFADDDVTLYSKAIMTKADMDYLGKAIPEEAQSDTGVVDESDSLEKRAERAAARKRQRSDKRKRDENSREDDVSEMSSPGRSFPTVLDARLKAFAEIEAKKLENDTLRLDQEALRFEQESLRITEETKKLKFETESVFLNTALNSGDAECVAAAKRILLERLSAIK